MSNPVVALFQFTLTYKCRHTAAWYARDPTEQMQELLRAADTDCFSCRKADVAGQLEIKRSLGMMRERIYCQGHDCWNSVPRRKVVLCAECQQKAKPTTIQALDWEGAGKGASRANG